jgi:hypothetical protein
VEHSAFLVLNQGGFGLSVGYRDFTDSWVSAAPFMNMNNGRWNIERWHEEYSGEGPTSGSFYGRKAHRFDGASVAFLSARG